MENLHNNGQEQNAHIDISQQAEIQQWAEKLNVPEEILKDAVRAAGTTVEEVAEHLNDNSPSRESASETVRLKDGPWHDEKENDEHYNPEGKSIEEATDPSKLSQL
ncbi:MULTISPECIES: DUF3606 domain-containing protein [Flavobacterium]|uniref:DUF3606 domain-containing protein n=1 Tax=Flavobacterium quisquiliarum TaxID=1834436 RepID=A0ABV8W3C8_9FLAO|nr:MULTISPECIES: DUF3606 domain-containing protein [Flavobacterium]MBW1655940.1 DUF3606 domain-containing protein [Flavobacterium quisquiliarum]